MSTENASPQTWRVVVACDEVQPHTHVREVVVYHNHLGWFTRMVTSIGLATPRAAVMEHAAKERWPVVDVRAPGAQTAAEAVAAEREACASLVDLCEQFARTMGDASADEYMKLAAALRARAQGGPTGDLDSRHAETPWRDLPDTDGLWWMWAGEGHDPEPVRVRTERENARDPRREYLYIERLGHEDTTHLDDVCERYGVISLHWCPLIPPEPSR